MTIAAKEDSLLLSCIIIFIINLLLFRIDAGWNSSSEMFLSWREGWEDRKVVCPDCTNASLAG